jgi:hypothetical protein
MTHAEAQVSLLEIALDLRRIDRRLDDLVQALDEPAGPRSLAAPEVEDGSDRPLNLAAAIQAQIVYARESAIESAIQDLCLAAQLSDDPERWRAGDDDPCRQDGAPGQGNGGPDLAGVNC